MRAHCPPRSSMQMHDLHPNCLQCCLLWHTHMLPAPLAHQDARRSVLTTMLACSIADGSRQPAIHAPLILPWHHSKPHLQSSSFMVLACEAAFCGTQCTRHQPLCPVTQIRTSHLGSSSPVSLACTAAVLGKLHTLSVRHVPPTLPSATPGYTHLRPSASLRLACDAAFSRTPAHLTSGSTPPRGLPASPPCTPGLWHSYRQ